MHHNLKPHIGPPRLLAAAAPLVAATTIAACGATSPTGSSTSAATSHPGTTSSLLAFSRCMRAHGVPNFPDLPSNVMRLGQDGQTVSVNGVSLNGPAFLAARATCRKYLPTPTGNPSQQAPQRAKALKFATCMRSHGVPTFPDPKFTTRGGQAAVYFGSGLDTASPAFQAAAKACGIGDLKGG